MDKIKTLIGLLLRYAFLAPASVLFIAYRIITIFFNAVRFNLLYRTVKRSFLSDTGLKFNLPMVGEEKV